MGLHIHFLNNIEHFHGCFDGSFGLVCVQPAGSEALVIVRPEDNGLYKGIGASAGRYGYNVIYQLGQTTLLTAVNFVQGFHKGIVLSVAAGCFLKTSPQISNITVATGRKPCASERA